MKILGIVCVAIGLSLLIFLVIHIVRQNNQVISPIPEDKGVKVIFVTPAK